MNLPDVIPIFPLPNATLFPGVPLPLHIFEPRYRDMVEAALKAEPSLIGMVLLRGDWQEDYAGRPAVYPVGCVGEMVQHKRLDDGRFNILLRGVREFEVLEEVGETSYRQARVRWREAPSDSLAADDRAALCRLVERFAQADDSSTQRKLVDDGRMEDEVLVNFVSHALELDPLEKQALLQAEAIGERARLLRQTIEFAIGAGSTGGEGGGVVH